MRLIFAFAICFSSTASAGEFNKVLSIGDAAPAWEDLEGTDGKKHSLDDLKAKDVVVVAFIANSCATVAEYEGRMIAFAGKYCGKDGKAAFVAISVNTIKEDSLPKMKERSEKKKYNFDYLIDPTQEIAKKFGAMYTPEFFVLSKDRKVIYMGAMDDKTKAADVKETYLVSAVEAALAGNAAPKAETLAASGCRIRFMQMK